MSKVLHVRLTALALALACANVSWAQSAPAAKAKPAASAVAPKAAAAGYLIEPAPAWVVPATERPGAPVEPAPMHYRVIDEQVLVDARSMWEYNHVVRVPNDSAGLVTASQIELEFDPSHQTLVLHHLEVVREGKRLNRLDRKRLQLLHRETQLERQMVDGRMTLSVVLEDVRVGDQVDFAYSIRGANPVFDGKFVHTSWLGSHRGPVALSQLRVLAPAERQIHHRVGSSDVKVETRLQGALRETVFRREPAPHLRGDQHTPFSAIVPHLVQLSEYADWAEVARWGERLFAQPGTGALLDEKAAQIKARHASREERLLAALEFVQKEVRYFGTEIGANTHRPAPPDKVIEQRFGDCKDKVLLLIALLKRLEIEAVPTLVSTSLRGRVAGMLPSPLAFDHVIAKVEHEGKPLWLDPTRRHQTGPLARRQISTYGKGLLLAPEARALAELPAAYATEQMVVKDTVRIERFSEDPVLESRITYRGDIAEMIREAVAVRGTQQLSSDLSSGYVRVYPKLKALGELRVEPVPDDDAVTFVQRFSVPDFWRFPEERMLVADMVQWMPIEAVAGPRTPQRRDPFFFPFPGGYRHHQVLEFPEDTLSQPPAPTRSEDGDAHFKLQTSVQGTRRRVEYLSEMRILVDQVEPSRWAAYIGKLNTTLPRVGSTISISAVPQDQLPALSAELAKVEAALKSRHAAAATQTQAEARYKAAIVSAQLAGGRLNPALQAQALRARGVALDHQGRIYEAAKDFEQALALAPDSVDTLTAAAVNALMRRQLDRAVQLTTQVLEKDPRHHEALQMRAMARYFANELPPARADLEQLLQEGPRVRSGFPLVWLSLVMRQSAQDPAALASRFTRDQLPDEWPRPLIDFALGSSDDNALIKAAQDAKKPREALCEAYFFIAEKYHAEGQAARAADYWRKAVDQGVVEYLEHGAAQLRLATVAKR